MFLVRDLVTEYGELRSEGGHVREGRTDLRAPEPRREKLGEMPHPGNYLCFLFNFFGLF